MFDPCSANQIFLFNFYVTEEPVQRRASWTNFARKSLRAQLKVEKNQIVVRPKTDPVVQNKLDTSLKQSCLETK